MSALNRISLDDIFGNASPKVTTTILALLTLSGSILYLLAVDFEIVSAARLVAVVVGIFVYICLATVWVNTHTDQKLALWLAISYALLPVGMSLLGRLIGLTSLKTTSEVIISLRWATLLLPFILATVTIVAKLAHFQVRKWL